MSIELEKIDCNCNNCAFLARDLDKFNYWLVWHKTIEENIFNKLKEKAIKEAEAIEDEANRKGMLRVAYKMKFQFDKSKLIGYGKCAKFGRDVTFIPGTCQLHTQNCFIHRRDIL